MLGCRSSSNEVPVHYFPKDAAKFELWKAAVFSEKIQGLSNNALRKMNICHRHFKEEDYFVGLRRRKLKPGVVPTLHLPEGDSIFSEEINVCHFNPLL